MKSRHAAGAATLVIAALTVTGCSSGGDAAPATVTVTQPVSTAATTVDAAVATTEAPTTTPKKKKAKKAASATTSSATPAAAPTPEAGRQPQTSLPTDVGLYADEWVRAWGLGVDEQMELYADRDVNAALLATSGGPEWARTRIESWSGGESLVVYTHNIDGSMLGLVVSGEKVSIGARHAITGALESAPGWDEWAPMTPMEGYGYPGEGVALPEAQEEGIPADLTTDPGAYADQFVIAWGAGNYADADVYASESGMYLFDLDAEGGGDWTRFGSAGSTVTYQDQGGNTLVVVLDLTLVGAGYTDGVTGAYVE